MSRRKGAVAERTVAKWFQANGFPSAERRGAGFEASDLIGMPGITTEIKDQAAIRLGDWFTQMTDEQHRDDNPIGLLVIKRKGHTDPGDWYCVTTLAQHTALLRQAGYGEPL